MESEETIFANARDIAGAAERAAYLTRACGNDAGLRQRVEAMLRDATEAEKFFGPETTVVTEGPGTVIGRYKLLQKIGEGGMGVVYMAEQREPVTRKVALKIIKLGMDTKQVVARFEAERQALALMDHPNIAKVLDGGATESGRPYFVMELVAGLPITQFCDDASLSTHDRLELFLDVCSAVQHAHQKGIIHRDLKPSNILVTLHGDKPVPKVIDFGVAKATQGRLTEKTLFTQFQQFIGTPAYMSPEQASLSGLDIDTRSDIYALGVLLYELLTGRTPFDGKELLKAGLDEMRRTIREDEPPRPSNRISTLQGEDRTTTAKHRRTDPPKLIHLVRGDLDWIVMKALEKDRARRYETANGLASDIKRHLSDEAIVARPPSAAYRFQKLVRRNKVVFAAVSAVAAALVIGLIVSTWLFFKAQAEKKKAQTEAAKSQQVAQFLKDMLNGVGPWIAMGRDTTLLRDIADKTAEHVDKDLKDQPEVQADLLETVGNIYCETGPIDKAEMLERESLAIRRKLFGDENLKVADSLHSLGLTLWRREKLDEAENVTREALAIRRKLLGNDDPQAATSLVQLGGIIFRTGKFAEAEAVEREAAQLRRKVNDDFGLAWALEFLGQTLDAEGKLDDAEATLRDAFAVAKKALGNEHLLLAESLRFLGYTLHHAGKLAEAESTLRDSLAVHRKVSDPQRGVAMAWTMTELAAVLNQQGKYYEAEALLREAWLIQQKVLGLEHANTTTTLKFLIDVLQKEGKTDKSGATLREPAAISQTPGNTDVYEYAHSLQILGEMMHREKKLPEAEAFLREALAALRKFPDQRRGQQLSWSLISLAAVLHEQGKLEEDEALLRESVAIYQTMGNTSAIEYEDSLRALGGSLLAQKKLPEAEVYLREAVAVNRKFSIQKQSPRLSWALGLLADDLRQQGKYAEAEDALREGLTIQRKALGDRHSDTTQTLHSLMDLLRQEGKTNEANALLEAQPATGK